MLGLDVDKNLNFNKYVSPFRRIACNKLPVLARLSNFMSLKQRRMHLKMFTES